MTTREVVALMDRYNADYRERWELARFTGLVSALTGKVKEKAFEKLTTFPWEKDPAKKEKPSAAKLDLMRKEYSEALHRFNEGKTEAIKI